MKEHIFATMESLRNMKIRTYKSRVNKMLNWYTERVTKDLMGFADIRTFAGMEYANRALTQAQYEKIKEEPQTVEWKFPVQAVVHLETNSDGNTRAELRVCLQEHFEEQNILYLDFDK